MEKELRAQLYNSLASHSVVYNPVEPEPFDLVDLTKDITNLTRVYHLRTQCVREALVGARLVVADSPVLANVVRQAVPRAYVAALPFGLVTPAAGPKEAGLTVGLLNHNGDMEHNNAYALKLLKGLNRPVVIYGRALPGIEGDVEEGFSRFCGRCDVLLLPSLPGAINSTTLPLAAMQAGLALLATNAPGYYELAAATGVQLLPADLNPWRQQLDSLETQPVKLRTMQERNRAFARRLNRDSFERLAPLLKSLPASRPPLRKGCCPDKTAPTEPTQDQPITEKEL